MSRSGPLGLDRRGDSTSTDPLALYDVPSGLLELYDKIGVGGTLSCDHQLDEGDGYTTNGAGKDGTHYCGDASSSPSYVYWMSNMDVDCDGGDTASTDCADDPSWLGDTAYQDPDGKNIDAVNVPYVVIDYDDVFKPDKDWNIQPLSVVAVVCGGKLVYGVWADTNALGSMGEASMKLAQTCFGSGMTGNFGHDEADVLYIAFPGDPSTTVPSGSGSDAAALKEMGDDLVAAAFGAGGISSPSNETATDVDTPPETSTTLSGGSGGGSKTASGDTAGGGSSSTATSGASRGSTAAPTSKGTIALSTAPGTFAPSSAPSSTGSSTTDTGFFDLSNSTSLALGACLFILIAGCTLAFFVLRHKTAQHTRSKRLHDKIYYGARGEDSDSDDGKGAPSRRKRSDGGSSDGSSDESSTDGSEEELVTTRRRRPR